MIQAASVRSAAAFILVVTALGACARPPASVDQPTDTGIVSGKMVGAHEAAAHSVVALVAVMDGGQALCSGTLLSDDTVLTAAHCVDHAPSKLVVVFGARVSEAKPAQLRPADSFAQNPRWRAPTALGRGDLAVVHFRGGLVDGYSPVHLISGSTEIKVGVATLMLGYGVTDGLTHAGAGLLRETQTTIIGRNSETELITDGRKGSVCFGDSGGPAFILSGSQPLQWGVASSVENQTCNKASIHTDISSYASWLRGAAQRLRKLSATSQDSARKNTLTISEVTDATMTTEDF